MGGPSYIKALKAPFPHVALIASRQRESTRNCQRLSFAQGAIALGIGEHLIPPDAVLGKKERSGLSSSCGRFLGVIKEARALTIRHWPIKFSIN